MNQSEMEKTHPPGQWLKVGDLNVHYMDWGGDGAPAVALHGAASSSHWYDLVIPHLRDRVRIIAPDQRGHGKTDQPSTGYDWATLAGDVVRTLDMLGIDRAAVMGHSWGASVALSVAALHPDRVTALAMIDGGFGAGPRSPNMTWEEFKERLSPRDIYGPRERYLGALRSQFDHCWSEQLEYIVMSMVRIDPDGSVHERLELENQQQMLWAMFSDPTYILCCPRCSAPSSWWPPPAERAPTRSICSVGSRTWRLPRPLCPTAGLCGYRTPVTILATSSRAIWPGRWWSSSRRRAPILEMGRCFSFVMPVTDGRVDSHFKCNT